MKTTAHLKAKFNLFIYEVFTPGEPKSTFTAKVDSRNSDFFSLIDDQISEEFGSRVDKVDHASRTIRLA